MSIRHRLMILFLSLVGLSALGFFLTWRTAQQIKTILGDIVDKAMPELESLEELRFSGVRIVSATAECLLRTWESVAMSCKGIGVTGDQEPAHASAIQYRLNLEAAESLTRRYYPAHLAALQRVRLHGDQLLGTGDEIVRLAGKARSGNGAGAILRRRFEREELAYLQAISELIRLQQRIVAERRQRARDAIELATWTGSFFRMVTVLAALAGCISALRSIAAPVQTLARPAELDSCFALRSGESDQRSGR